MSGVYATTSDLDADACGHYPEFSKVEGFRRRTLVRDIRRLATQRMVKGMRDAQTIAEEVQSELMTKEEFNSIVVIIGLAVLSAIIQYVVKKLLERWFGGMT